MIFHPDVVNRCGRDGVHTFIMGSATCVIAQHLDSLSIKRTSSFVSTGIDARSTQLLFMSSVRNVSQGSDILKVTSHTVSGVSSASIVAIASSDLGFWKVYSFPSVRYRFNVFHGFQESLSSLLTFQPRRWFRSRRPMWLLWSLQTFMLRPCAITYVVLGQMNGMQNLLQCGYSRNSQTVLLHYAVPDAWRCTSIL